MLTKIVLIVAMCAGTKYESVQERFADLQKSNPGAQVSLKLDTKARCYKGQVLTGKDAKMLDRLQGKSE